MEATITTISQVVLALRALRLRLLTLCCTCGSHVVVLGQHFVDEFWMDLLLHTGAGDELFEFRGALNSVWHWQAICMLHKTSVRNELNDGLYFDLKSSNKQICSDR